MNMSILDKAKRFMSVAYATWDRDNEFKEAHVAMEEHITGDWIKKNDPILLALAKYYEMHQAYRRKKEGNWLGFLAAEAAINKLKDQ